MRKTGFNHFARELKQFFTIMPLRDGVMDAAFREAQMEVYFQRVPFAAFGKFTCAIYLCWQLMNHGAIPVDLLAWAFLAIGQCAYLVAVHRYKAELIARHGITRIYQGALASAALSAIIWGAIACIVLLRGSSQSLACLVFCIAGMMAGANFAYATLRLANFVFYCGITLGLVIGAIPRGAQFFIPFLVLLVMYLLIVGRLYRLSANDFFQRLADGRKKLEDTAQTLKILLSEHDAGRSDLLWEVNAAGYITSVADVSHQLVELSGLDKEKILGAQLTGLFADSAEKTSLAQNIRQGTPFRDLTLKLRGEGAPVWWRLRAGPIDGSGDAPRCMRGIATDVTLARREEERMVYMAHYDSLTGIANRTLFNETLARAMSDGKTGTIAVMYLDFDKFKTVNDTFGHDVGDRLLEQIARRLENCIKPNGMVARFGGDEFVILLTDISSRDVVEKAAGRIVAEMNQTFDIEPHEIHNSASVGVAMWQDIHLTAKELIKRADAALYAAKEHGRNQFCFFDAATMTIAARSAESRNGNASGQMAHEATP